MKYAPHSNANAHFAKFNFHSHYRRSLPPLPRFFVQVQNAMPRMRPPLPPLRNRTTFNSANGATRAAFDRTAGSVAHASQAAADRSAHDRGLDPRRIESQGRSAQAHAGAN
jgi:hypothetical protein